MFSYICSVYCVYRLSLPVLVLRVVVLVPTLLLSKRFCGIAIVYCMFPPSAGRTNLFSYYMY
jgi:hypothetical protein